MATPCDPSSAPTDCDAPDWSTITNYLERSDTRAPIEMSNASVLSKSGSIPITVLDYLARDFYICLKTITGKKYDKNARCMEAESDLCDFVTRVVGREIKFWCLIQKTIRFPQV